MGSGVGAPSTLIITSANASQRPAAPWKGDAIHPHLPNIRKKTKSLDWGRWVEEVEGLDLVETEEGIRVKLVSLLKGELNVGMCEYSRENKEGKRRLDLRGDWALAIPKEVPKEVGSEARRVRVGEQCNRHSGRIKV
ncbi:hypothetical protein M0802_015229 [Mischocyttarus mexicanus]|nr:hypothetical protein M0802_015229 [Mischocyttarus mexicanus]